MPAVILGHPLFRSRIDILRIPIPPPRIPPPNHPAPSILNLRLLPLFVLLTTGSLTQAATLIWKAGPGSWEDASHWGGALPGRADIAMLESDANISLTHGDVICSRVEVGPYHEAKPTLTVSGGGLWVSELLRIGEYPGTASRLIQTGGEINALEICVGGANTGHDPTARSIAAFEISGGKVITRHLTLGWATGSATTLRISGSKAAPIAVLDYLWVGIREPTAAPSAVTLAYEIDAEGVSPIILWSRKASRVALIDKGSRSTCTLQLSLKAPPPTGAIPLIQLPQPCSGTFTALPEGAKVKATHAGQTYEWTLTYTGGLTKSDVVLTDPHIVTAAGSRTPCTTGMPAKKFTLTAADVQASMTARLSQMQKDEAAIDTARLPAFPGAAGFGAYTPGGRCGRPIFVTNLNDSGPGSLRAALTAKGPRTVIFRVGGVIKLQTSLQITEPFITVAGQTAPGQGICIRASSDMHADTLSLSQTHDVILRHLRVENGLGQSQPRPGGDGDCISAYDSANFIVDHCSAHFGTDETLSATGACDLCTVQWCIISEGLNYEKHSMSTLLGGSRSTWHHNLFAHAGSRNPNLAGEPRCAFINNVIYDWGHTAGQGSFAQLNFAGNYFKPGPSTVLTPPNPWLLSGNTAVIPGTLHFTGNVLEGDDKATSDNWLRTQFDRGVAAPTPLPLLSAPIDPAATAYAEVLKSVGATQPHRSPADHRVITDTQNRTGQIISSQTESGGWTELPETFSTLIDTDSDGLPDLWETQHKLNAKDSQDAQSFSPSGYSWLELYLNELAQ